MRISRAQMFMAIARAAAMRSTCMRLNVGAVITANSRPLSIGYNGAEAGQSHCSGNDCPGRDLCTQTIHAEVNAFDHLPQLHSAIDYHLYCTHSPCARCVERIAYEMPQKVFFETPFRETDNLRILKGKNIGLYQVTPAGYVMEYWTREVVEMP